MYYAGSSKVLNAAKADTEAWKDTGFAGVSNVTSGRARAVWLVFDFYPVDAASGERYHVGSDHVWGWLPRHGENDDEQYRRRRLPTLWQIWESIINSSLSTSLHMSQN